MYLTGFELPSCPHEIIGSQQAADDFGPIARLSRHLTPLHEVLDEFRTAGAEYALPKPDPHGERLPYRQVVQADVPHSFAIEA